jgi:chemotaxis family two-component system sensor kinase Cph1
MKEPTVPLENVIMRSRLKYYTLALAVVWTSILVLALALSIKDVRKDTKNLAYGKAIAHFNKDQALRFWATEHGGVYVPVTEQTQSSPYLVNILERDIATPAGKRLTLMNPAYVVRQMNEWFASLYGVYGHITSLKPLRPENAPDDWEQAALVAFEQGSEEVSQFSSIEEQPFFRFMRPMLVKTGCLKCHGHQGYEAGEVRGGVSVSVPLTPLLATQQGRIKTLVLTCSLLWMIGLSGIGFGWRQIRKSDDDRNRVQKTLIDSQGRYQRLWDNAPAAYHMLDVEGIIRQVNRTELDMLGYTRDEMLGKPIFEFVMPEQRDDAEERFRLKLLGKEIPKQDNRKYLKKDGSEVNVSIDDILERDTDGKVLGVRTTMVNITDLKRAQEELRHLSAQLLEVQENERKKLSRELHDSTGQLLAALKFGIENALDKVRHGTIGESVELLETVIPIAKQASDEVRRIHTDLRPSLIDDLGIVATISWFCREFETLHAGVRMEQMIHIGEEEVPEPLKIVIFRILQEAVNNIAKYGKANQVRVFLREKDGKLELAIEDNGQGFDVEHVRSEKNADRGVGLTSMRERTEFSGGSFSIESKKGAGTTVRASWPYGSEKSIS